MAIFNALPFTLQNGQTADATQVMANFNQMVSNGNANGAHSGANSDITSLSALTTPLTPAQGGTVIYTGGTSTGAGNAQVVASLTPTGFVLTAGSIVQFIAGFTNTGATTLNANATGATNIFKQTTSGIAALAGGEIVANQLVQCEFDGTQFQLLGFTPQVIVPVRTRQTLKSGSSATYTTPANCRQIYVRMVGGGGGGGGTGTSGSPAGGNGGDTVFSTITAGGGKGGGAGTGGATGDGGNGGTITGSPDVGLAGGTGGEPAVNSGSGGHGAASPFAGGGRAGFFSAGGPNAGIAAPVNSGAGGGGSGCGGSVNSAGGGGAGAYAEFIINTPSATYTYTVGAAGIAGVAGASGANGGLGGSGIIIVDEYY